MNTRIVTHLEPQLANCRDYWLGWGAVDRADDGFTYYRSGLDHAQFNGVLRLREAKQTNQAEQVEQAIALARSRLAGVPWVWWVGPDSPAATGGQLVAHGAEEVERKPIMAIDLERIDGVEGPDELKIETVVGPVDLAEWVRVYHPSFGIGSELRGAVASIEAGRADSASTVRVTGYLAGRPVGTSLMLDAHGVAGIYVVTTAEGYRRQGIGAAVTTAALRAGRDRGLHIGTLQASGMGAPLYARMGFETIAAYHLFRFPT
ncbi:MAG: GNAT family N-acetyltransferase [Actinopolymorphaceae bacterium]